MARKLWKNGLTVVLFIISATVLTSVDARSEYHRTAPSSSSSVSAEYLVEFNSDVMYFRMAIESMGGRVNNIWDGIQVAAVSNLSADAAAQLSARTFVVRMVRDVSVHWVNAISPNMNVRVQAAADNTSVMEPSDAEFFGIQWGLQDIDIAAAWNVTRGSSTVRVGVLDTGISPDHVDLKGKYDLDASVNFSASNPADPKDYIDRHYHGTHVSALIASNNFGVASVAPQVTLVGIKVLDDEGNASFARLIQGIMYAVDFAKVDVINLSLGGIGEEDAFADLSEMLHRAVDYAESHGAVVVASAGNDNSNLHTNLLRSFVTTDEAGTILVSATTPGNEDGFVTRACYSNYGDSMITLAAPGGNIDCSDNSYLSMSDMVLSALAPAVARKLGLKNPDGWYLFSSGTSMAAPIVTGSAALIKSAYPGLTPAAIVSRLTDTASDLGQPGRDDQYGFGLVNPAMALRDIPCTTRR